MGTVGARMMMGSVTRSDSAVPICNRRWLLLRVDDDDGGDDDDDGRKVLLAATVVVSLPD